MSLINVSPSLATDLLTRIENLPTVEQLTDLERGSLRSTICLYLNGKIIPELRRDGDLPLIVGVQGGTNVGKSTIFNALAGQLLSPAVVQGSATKHPLILLNECWRETFLTGNLLPEFQCTELADPKEILADAERTELLFTRFHADESLRSIALVDSPDFDSALATNPIVARKVTVLSDLTVFVTTAQKYRDRELVDHLRNLLELKANVIVLFNMVDEEIVFETLAEDLRVALGTPKDAFRTLRVPSVRDTAHPEEALRGQLTGEVLATLQEQTPAAIKPVVVAGTCRALLAHVDELCARLDGEIVLQKEVREFVAKELDSQLKSYAGDFDLALPEETAAARLLLRQTELLSLIRLPSNVAETSSGLMVVRTAVSRANDTIRRVLMRLSARDEGALDDSPAAAAEYAQARDATDRENVWRRADALSRSVEMFLRVREKTSPLARELLRVHFSPEQAESLPISVRTAFDTTLPEIKSAENILSQVGGWLEKPSAGRAALRVGALAIKTVFGIFTARLIPPDGINFLNVLYFAAGYLVAAYLIALAISLAVRRKPQFRRERRRNMRAVLEKAVVGPLEARLGETLREDDVAGVAEAARALGAAFQEEESVRTT